MATISIREPGRLARVGMVERSMAPITMALAQYSRQELQLASGLMRNPLTLFDVDGRCLTGLFSNHYRTFNF